MTIEASPLITDTEPSQPTGDAAPLVPQPASIEETGVDVSLLADLALRIIHFSGRPSGRQVAEQLALPYSLAEEIIGFLRQQQVVEIVGSVGVGEQAYQYAPTDRGRKRADEALARSQYVGPAPGA